MHCITGKPKQRQKDKQMDKRQEALEGMLKTQLYELCRQYGIKKSGLKAELVERVALYEGSVADAAGARVTHTISPSGLRLLPL